MKYYFNVLNGNVYNTRELKGERLTLIKWNLITPITDNCGKNYCILTKKDDVNNQHDYKVIKKEHKTVDYENIISALKEQGYIIVKDFDITDTIKM